MSTPTDKALARWFGDGRRADTRNCVAYARALLAQYSTLPETSHPLVQEASHLAAVRLPALRREHDAALRRRERTRANRAGRRLAISSRHLRGLLAEIRDEAARHQPVTNDWGADFVRAFGGQR